MHRWFEGLDAGRKAGDRHHLDGDPSGWLGAWPSGEPVGELLFDDIAHVEWRILL